MLNAADRQQHVPAAVSIHYLTQCDGHMQHSDNNKGMKDKKHQLVTIAAIAVDIQETAEDRTVCSELSIALAASDTLLFSARTARTSFRFCLFCFVRCPNSLDIMPH